MANGSIDTFEAIADRIRADIRHSWRSLRSDRGYFIGSVASLAIGIGGAALTFGILLALLFPSLPYRDQARLGVVQPAPSWDLVERLKQVPAFDSVAAYNEQAANLVGGTEPQRVLVGRVSADFMQVADLKVVAGRPFNEGDFSHGHDDVALLTTGIWRR